MPAVMAKRFRAVVLAVADGARPDSGGPLPARVYTKPGVPRASGGGGPEAARTAVPGEPRSGAVRRPSPRARGCFVVLGTSKTGRMTRSGPRGVETPARWPPCTRRQPRRIVGALAICPVAPARANGRLVPSFPVTPAKAGEKAGMTDFCEACFRLDREE